MQVWEDADLTEATFYVTVPEKVFDFVYSSKDLVRWMPAVLERWVLEVGQRQNFAND